MCWCSRPAGRRCWRPRASTSAIPSSSAGWRCPLRELGHEGRPGTGRAGRRLRDAAGKRHVRLNLSASMPVGLWWIEAAEPRRGDTVLVCLPGDAGAIARERDYVGPGECPGDRAPLLKPVAAVFPDIVTVGTDGIAIDGAPLANSMALPTDTAGRPLTAMPPGR